MVQNGSLEDESTTLSVPEFVKVEGGDDKIDSSAVTQPDSTEYIEVGVSTVKRYNFLVAGGIGSGKTTFCKRMLSRYFPTLKIKPCEGSTLHIEERGRCEKRQGSTRIIFTVVDTPGFGDLINNEDRISPVIEYIEAQNQKYEEGEGYRHFDQQEADSRIHCCFYFFTPHRVTSLDLEFMRRLQAKVPIVPIVAKTDTLMTKEREQQLFNIHKALEENNIKIFDFEEQNIDDSWLAGFPSEESPFACVGKTLVAAEGDPLLPPSANQKNAESLATRRQIPNVFTVLSGQRDYLWGVACEDNPLHSDTPRLHDVLFKNTSMQSLGRLQRCANEIHDLWRKAREEDQCHRDNAKAKEEEEIKKRLEEEKVEQQQLATGQRNSRIRRGLACLGVAVGYIVLWALRSCIWNHECLASWWQEYEYLFERLIPLAFELAGFLYALLLIATHGN